LQTFFRVLALYPPARAYFAEMKFKPKPKLGGGFLVRAAPDAASSLVGLLFPQALVMTASGFALSDDVLGDGFALVAPPGTSPGLLARATLDARLPVRLVAFLHREDTSPVAAPAVAARDLRGDLAALLAGRPPGLFLLRPDRYVAAFLPADCIAAAADDVAHLVQSTWTRNAEAARATERVSTP
jgi:3-(3-hydroxy-phenyl)propionate hydroxylase